MKTLYLDCSMGAAGDMLTAALLELLPEPQEFIRKLNDLQIPAVQFKADKVLKCGILGTYMSVTVNGMEEDEQMHEQDSDHSHESAHHCQHLENIQEIVQSLHITEKIKKDILNIYRIIAEAESHVHGISIEEIHFHEVGNMDAVADITAFCLLMEELAPEQIIVSPIHVGSGHVKCAHGMLPVPTPATVYILQNVPIYGGAIQGELCTPTGAALLKYFADQFDDLPPIKINAIGYGMGKKDFPRANCIRALWGESQQKINSQKIEDQPTAKGQSVDTIIELSCNLDDMTSEEIGFAIDILWENGAKDVYTIPIGMKKSRPAIMLCVMCELGEKEKFIALLFKHTTTIGIREIKLKRYVLEREMEKIETKYGPIQRKVSHGYGIVRTKYEYEELAALAKKHQLSLQELKKILPADQE